MMITERTKSDDLLRNYTAHNGTGADQQLQQTLSFVSAKVEGSQLFPPQLVLDSDKLSQKESKRVQPSEHIKWSRQLPVIELNHEEVIIANYLDGKKFAESKESSSHRAVKVKNKLMTENRHKDETTKWTMLLFGVVACMAILLLGYFLFSKPNVRNQGAKAISAETITNNNANSATASAVAVGTSDRDGGVGTEESEREEFVSNQESVEPTNRYDCALIVGAFADEQNVLRMTNRLQERNYEVYTEQRGRLTLVGALSMSDDRAVLSDLRRHITAEAWYIHFD